MTLQHRSIRLSRSALRVRRRPAVSVAAVVVAAVMLVSASQAAVVKSDAAPATEYVPFVTDFPKPGARSAPQKPYVPFVTDFPKTSVAPGGRAADPRTPAHAAKTTVEWGDVAVGLGIGTALAAMLAGSGLVLTRRTGALRS